MPSRPLSLTAELVSPASGDHVRASARITPMSSTEAPVTETLIPAETAKILKVSVSWLAKARMLGDGPPFMRVGRSIRYIRAALLQWMKSKQRLSTSEQ
jgi:Helix-turn-helix domain